MARTAQDMQGAINRHLPEDLIGAEGSRLDALCFGMATVLANTDKAVEDLFQQATISGGNDIWLANHGHSLGYQTIEGETDASLRVRLQTVQHRVTLPAILDGLNALLATESTQQAYGFSRKIASPFDIEGSTIEGEQGLCWDWNAIYLYLPQLPELAGSFTVEGEAFEGDAVEGKTPTGEPTSQANALRAVLESEAMALRAAGMRVFFFTYI